jgi:hypothetical protein
MKVSSRTLIETARTIPPKLQAAVEAAGLSWDRPHVTLNFEEDPTQVCLEWWKGSRKLTLWIELPILQVPDETFVDLGIKVYPFALHTVNLSLLRVWGYDINDEMSDHELDEKDLSEFAEHWAWLNAVSKE